MSRLNLLSLSAFVASLLPLVRSQCDAQYTCEYKSPDAFGAYYDLSGLCHAGTGYTFVDWKGNMYRWNICGNAPVDCIPNGYDVEFQRAPVMQFFGPAPANTTCHNRLTNQTVPCTADCEVLGWGLPTFSLINPKNPAGGVNITHYSVAPKEESNNPFECGIDPNTGAPRERKVTIQIACNQSAFFPHIVNATDISECNYLIQMQSSVGCGCIPDCWNKNCGGDGCHGVCGAAGSSGQCPEGQVCSATSQTCCKPDCRSRSCGDDGCGGSCGDCYAHQMCSRNQCIPNGTYPSQIPLASAFPTVTKYTTTPGDHFAAFLGGIITVGFITMVTVIVLRYRKDYYMRT